MMANYTIDAYHWHHDTVFDTCMRQAPSMRHLPDWEAVGALYEEVCSEHTLRFSSFSQQLMNRNMSEDTAQCSGKKKIVCSQCYISAFFCGSPLKKNHHSILASSIPHIQTTSVYFLVGHTARHHPGRPYLEAVWSSYLQSACSYPIRQVSH